MQNTPKLYHLEDEETGKKTWHIPRHEEQIKLVRVPDYDMIDSCVRLSFIGATLSILVNIFAFCLFVEQVKASGWCFSNFALLCCVTAYYFLFVHPFIKFIRKWKR